MGERTSIDPMEPPLTSLSTDSQLVGRVQQGDVEAMEHLFERYQARPTRKM